MTTQKIPRAVCRVDVSDDMRRYMCVSGEGATTGAGAADQLDAGARVGEV